MKTTSDHCSLEMALLASASASSSTYSSAISYGDHGRQLHPQQQQQQQMTIFYNGSVCVCDVTEFQAKAILQSVSRVAEEGSTAPIHPNSPSLQRPLYRLVPDAAPVAAPAAAAAPAPVAAPSAAPAAAAALAPAPAPPPAMKRSLQRFLEKRNHRMHAAARYHH